jgi:hypothetical protein
MKTAPEFRRVRIATQICMPLKHIRSAGGLLRRGVDAGGCGSAKFARLACATRSQAEAHSSGGRFYARSFMRDRTRRRKLELARGLLLHDQDF